MEFQLDTIASLFGLLICAGIGIFALIGFIATLIWLSSLFQKKPAVVNSGDFNQQLLQWLREKKAQGLKSIDELINSIEGTQTPAESATKMEVKPVDTEPKASPVTHTVAKQLPR